MVKNKTRYKIIASAFVLIVLGLLLWFLFSGGNLELIKSLFLEEHTSEEIRDKLTDLGIRGYATVAILSMLQVVFTFLPAEPVQVVAGLAFGFPIGILCCTIGVAVGNTAIYVMYRLFGNKIRDYFTTNLHVDLSKVSGSKKITIAIFILYFLPAIPYGMICFLAASLGMKFPRFIIVTVLGSIPSICIGVALGHMALMASWVVSVIVFAIIVALVVLIMIKREYIFKKVNEYLDRPPYTSKIRVRKYSYRILDFAYVVSRIIFFLKGVKVKYTSKLKEDIETPSIVLCNHGSFIDFAYAGSLIRKKAPNFIVARLYFYKSILGRFLCRLGCFPKSMFAQDINSARNCVSVLRSGGVLAMMPEARLSTAGRFEDIQKGTFAFLKNSGVTVYTVKIQGDYLADPKWNSGLVRGSLIEAELDILFTKEEIASLSLEEIEERTTERLYYDEFEWIKTHPELHYKSKELAEGLENILTKCPICKHKYTIRSKKRDLFCSKCGKVATLDDRYSFVGSEPFANFGDWFDWQKKELEKEICDSESYSLSDRVEYHKPSVDAKAMLRKAGVGVCTLDKTGLTYEGTEDGSQVTKHFALSDIYRLLFGAGESFEVYVGSEINFFKPENRQSAVDWYIASMILYDAQFN